MQHSPVVDTSRERGQKVILERPWGITAIACFQLLKGMLLVLTATLLRLKPDWVTGSKSIFYPLLYVAMRGNTAAVDAATQSGGENDTLLIAVTAVIFALGSYISAIGFGLWNIKQWARRSVLFTCGLSLVFYVKTIFFPTVADNGTGPTQAQPNMVSFYIVMAIDALIFLYFLRSNTADLFKNNAHR